MSNAVKKRSKLAVTMMEICIVGLLASIILGIGMAMMTRSNRDFKKGNDLINIQRLMDNIVERIRSDIRSLKKIREDECDENTFVFEITKNGENSEKFEDDEDKKNIAVITYTYDPDEKTFYRSIKTSEEELESDFHGAKQVVSMVFKPEYDEEDETKFSYLNVAMQIASNELGGGKNDASTLSIACQFYSSCVESELRISKLRSQNRN